jgi:5-methylcytosine-specific restriction endonuclease McrA
MFKKPFVRKSASGSARIVRDSYSNAKTSWWDLRKRVVERDGGKCQATVGWNKCGAKAVDVHHIIPLSRGGTSTMGNLISLCKDCHEARHNHMRR